MKSYRNELEWFKPEDKRPKKDCTVLVITVIRRNGDIMCLMDVEYKDGIFNSPDFDTCVKYWAYAPNVKKDIDPDWVDDEVGDQK